MLFSFASFVLKRIGSLLELFGEVLYIYIFFFFLNRKVLLSSAAKRELPRGKVFFLLAFSSLAGHPKKSGAELKSIRSLFSLGGVFLLVYVPQLEKEREKKKVKLLNRGNRSSFVLLAWFLGM